MPRQLMPPETMIRRHYAAFIRRHTCYMRLRLNMLTDCHATYRAICQMSFHIIFRYIIAQSLVVYASMLPAFTPAML